MPPRPALRLHASPASAPAPLVPGRDLVLHLRDGDGLDVPQGVAVDDHLDVEARRELDRLALAAWARWRAASDAPLTVEEVVLPFVAEWPLFARIMALLRPAAGLRAALVATGATAVESALPAGAELDVARAVAAELGLELRVTGGAAADAPVRSGRARRPPVRRRVVSALVGRGAPSRMRRGAVLVMSYWPLEPTIDALIADRAQRVAIPLDKRPEGPARSLRCMVQGGWVGVAGARARREAAAACAEPLRRAQAMPPPELGTGNPALDAVLHRELLAALAATAAGHLATARVIRAALRRGRPAAVLGTYDTMPLPRLVVSLAAEQGIPSVLLAHGAYLMPQTLSDLTLGDRVGVFSDHVAPPAAAHRPNVHVVGYPLHHELGDLPRDAGRIVVLGANGHLYTSMIDERIVMRHLDVALTAIAAARPDGEVVLRPHPSQPVGPLLALIERHPSLRVSIDTTTEIVTLLAGAGLCVGSQSAATLQAAVAGCPVVVLNVTGFDWPWPLGGHTPVPVARTAAELAPLLARAEPEGARAALLAGLGADRPGTTQRMLGLVAEVAP